MKRATPDLRPMRPHALARASRILLVLVPLLGVACKADPSAPPPPAPSSLAVIPGPWASAATASAAPVEAPPVPTRSVAGAAHILVAYKGALGAAPTIGRTPADAKKRAEEVRKKLLDNKATFEELVKQYSDDAASKPAGGQVGNFEPNVMPKAFSDATFALPVGGISEVVETPRGFHIIRRTK